MKIQKIYLCLFTTLLFLSQLATAGNTTEQVNIEAGKKVTHVTYNYSESGLQEGTFSVDTNHNGSGKVTLKLTSDLSTSTANYWDFDRVTTNAFLGNVIGSGSYQNVDTAYYYFEGSLSVDGNNIYQPLLFARMNDDSIPYTTPTYWGKSYKWKFGTTYNPAGTPSDSLIIQVYDQNNVAYCLHGSGGDNNNTLVIDKKACNFPPE